MDFHLIRLCTHRHGGKNKSCWCICVMNRTVSKNISVHMLVNKALCHIAQVNCLFHIVLPLHSPGVSVQDQTSVKPYMTTTGSSPGLCHPGESEHTEVCY